MMSERFELCISPRVCDDDYEYYYISDKYESIIEAFEFTPADDRMESDLKRLVAMLNNMDNRINEQQKEITALSWVKEYIKKDTECRKPLSDDDIRRLYGRLQEKEYRKHCSGNHCYTLDTSDNRMIL